MDEDDWSGAAWRVRVAASPPLVHDAQALGRLIEVDHDPAETCYYEACADPDAQALDNAQRSHAAQYLRRLRRIRERRRHDGPDNHA